MKFKRVLLGLLAAGLGLTNVGVTYAKEVKVLESIYVKQLGKQEFLNYASSMKTIHYLHDKETTKEWYRADCEYLDKEISQEKLYKEIEELKKILSDVRDNHAMEFGNGLRVYGYTQTEVIDVLIDSINSRYEKLNYYVSTNAKSGVATIGSYRYSVYNKFENKNSLSDILEEIYGESTIRPDEETLKETAEGVYEALTQYEMPKGITNNLDVYISPYYLDGYKGFTYSKSLIGREEEVIVAPSITEPSKQTAIDTTLHELGHVFLFDTMGEFGAPKGNLSSVNSQMAKELFAVYPDKKADEACEEFAEDFRRYIQHINKSSNADEVDMLDKLKEVFKLIESKLPTYDEIDKQVRIPEITIGGEKIYTYYLGTLPLIDVHSNEVEIVISQWDFNGSEKLYYDVLMRDAETDEAIRLVDKQEVTKDSLKLNLDKGEYLIILHDGNDITYRVNEFNVR